MPVTPARHERDRQLVQRHIHQHLVEGPVEERRVDAHHRVQATHRQPRRGGDRVLLGDPDVEHAVGELGGETVQAGRVQHRRGQRHHVGALAADGDQLVRQHPSPGRAAGQGGRRDRVQAVDLVGLGNRASLAFDGDAVHHHRAPQRSGVV